MPMFSNNRSSIRVKNFLAESGRRPKRLTCSSAMYSDLSAWTISACDITSWRARSRSHDTTASTPAANITTHFIFNSLPVNQGNCLSPASGQQNNHNCSIFDVYQVWHRLGPERDEGPDKEATELRNPDSQGDQQPDAGRFSFRFQGFGPGV